MDIRLFFKDAIELGLNNVFVWHIFRIRLSAMGVKANEPDVY